MSLSVNTANNQPIGLGNYDANGNTQGTSNYPGTPAYVWDIENRLVTTQPAVYQPTDYTYDPWGRRMGKEVPGGLDSNGNRLPTPCEIYFYGATGQKLETYSCMNNTDGTFNSTLEGINIYFGGKLLQAKGVWVATDKLGSVRANSNGETFSYFPYGEERTSTADGREKFATYTRDGVGQDYAQQRYYNANMGAFWSPDPGGVKTANPKNPSSWNRYGYTKGNPIGRFDPHGLEDCDPDDGDGCCDDVVCCDEDPDDPECQAPGGGGPGPQKPAKKKKKTKANPCDTTNPANAKVINFIDAHLTDATSLATQLNVPVQDILGIAAEESDYGQDYKVPLTNNYFGNHPPASQGATWPGQVSTYQTSKDGLLATFTAATGFYDSGEVLVNALLGVSGVTSGLAGFVAAANSHGWGTGQSNFATLATGTINSIASRLDCGH